MIVFKSISFAERLMMLWPPYRKKKDQELEEAIRFLVKSPMSPCIVDGHYIPNGMGGVILASNAEIRGGAAVPLD